MMATQYYAPKVDFYTPTDAYEAFETLVYGNVTGESLFRTLDRPDTYAAIIQKGECFFHLSLVMQKCVHGDF